MTQKEIPTRTKKPRKLSHNFLACWPVEIDHDVATKNNVERAAKRIWITGKIQFLEEKVLLNTLLDLEQLARSFRANLKEP